ncbi:pentatricopeptide repeat-containing protein At5g47360 [Rosa rugosa]|uniref:pentatricopeptide repeat-containing protein At5g47360 n=1 Tax=Rosa rugosa TaxID=74645 RepID=UPI002B4182F4|nr:pentatricopeptide repeat-containing protein At5g47360 [Rosa rugosa]XP_062029955.1 pentatricopeptide repeat-containing protein At5g47360 [Rosa rugosa]XP_062029956.1 pentatricopeptide repeat-containing protein At5g47360 [Rosa rugosa]XP_062029957.1 pentatricopeptide repeat-containing protein At5g47360 [Rosa rugosa]XP_062029958.1 pentatricopeptide repeat-containing protein At5g47360 [Rosa rugosa]XP_062029959.1 pentatricopeptide repeat-containing protein At5g47360 [Rosa rugosa]XP_062029960.1 pe
MTTLSSISRFLSSSIRLKNHKLSISHFSTASSAETVYNHLQKNGGNIEKTLASMRLNLDSKCVSQVLHRCYPTQSQMGLRFFIWAGVHSSYRHSYFMFSKACELYRIRQNPSVIFDVLEAYSVEGCSVNMKMFKVVFNMCKEAKLADEALRVLRKMPEFGLRGDNVVYNVVIRLFCDKGDLDMAESLVKEMSMVELYPDLITYMVMIKGLCNVGRLDDACGLFKFMKENGCLPNVVVYSALLDGFCRFGDMERALKLLEEMEKEGGDCSPNVVTYTSVIQYLCDKGQSVEALLVLDRMEARGCLPTRVTVSSLITGFVKEDQVEQAYKLVDRVVESGSVTKTDCYSSLVVALERVRKPEEAEKVFRTMLDSGVKPNSLVSTIMLKKRCLEGRMVDAYCLFDELEKMECLSSIDSDTYSILLVGLCQQRHLMEAAKLARVMLSKGIKLKAPYVDIIAEVLMKSGDEELLEQLTRNGR